jgi:hypothetical protein
MTKKAKMRWDQDTITNHIVDAMRPVIEIRDDAKGKRMLIACTIKALFHTLRHLGMKNEDIINDVELCCKIELIDEDE